ncbi:MAG TPA: hypothetical protein PLU50_11040 [Pseudobdellovibrionaceae bacterium]|nr:hypothetical protein [Pseudobdellovibrionaceae bacterium]
MKTQNEGETVGIAFLPFQPKSGDSLKRQLERALPADLHYWIDSSTFEFLESEGKWVVLISEKQMAIPLLVHFIGDWLRMICIAEQCSAFDERHLIELLGILSENEDDKALLVELRAGVFRHIEHAKCHFEGDRLFHWRSNAEFVSFGGMG